MAFKERHNISSTNVIDLIAAGENAGNIRSILLTNTHSSNSISVDLYLENNFSRHYIVRNSAIPSGVSLELDVSKISIDTSTDQDYLRIKCSTNGGLDVIINK